VQTNVSDKDSRQFLLVLVQCSGVCAGTTCELITSRIATILASMLGGQVAFAGRGKSVISVL